MCIKREREASDSEASSRVWLPSSTRIDVVSMPNAVERRAVFAEAASGARAEWRFVDAQTAPPADVPYSDQAAVRRFGRTLSRGEIGCFASHMAAWKSLLASSDTQRIVLEDDTIVDWPLMDRIAEVDFAGLGIDLVRFYSTHAFQHSVAIERFLGPHTHLLQTRGMFLGTQGYLLTRRAASRLVELARGITMPVDWFMTRYWAYGFRNYCVFPFPLIERFVPSNIGDRSQSQPRSPVERVVRQGFRVFDRVSRGFADHVRFRRNPFEPTRDVGPSFVERMQPARAAEPLGVVERAAGVTGHEQRPDVAVVKVALDRRVAELAQPRGRALDGRAQLGVQLAGEGGLERDRDVVAQVDVALPGGEPVCAEHVGAEHHEFVVRPDAMEVLPLLVEHYGEPYADSSAIPTYYVSRETRRHVTVALNGDGGDEAFAGYERYAAMRLAGRLPAPAARGGARLLRALPTGRTERRSPAFRAARLLEAAGVPRAERYGGLMQVLTLEQRAEPIDDSARDEIGALARAFNAMAAQLRRMDETKEEFFATLSHELRSPLTSVREAAHLLRDGVPGPLNAKQTRLVTLISRSTDRLLRLVNQILELSRLRAGVLPLARASVDMAQVVGRAVEELRPQAEEAGLTLERERVGARFDCVGDEDRLLQVVVNLVANAVRFTPRGGRVAVRLVDAGEELEVQVEDSGVGIPAAALPHIFDSWRQAHRDRGGTGLGLAVVRGIVQAHGGSIRAERAAGHGTRMTFVIPALS